MIKNIHEQVVTLNVMMPPWVEEIKIDNLPNEDLKIVATLLSLDVVIALMEELPGVNVAIPVKATRKYKILYVIKNYDGTKKTRLRLAKQCGFSENYIYKLVRDKNKYLEEFK